MCRHWEAGECQLGDGCNFAHPADRLASAPRQKLKSKRRVAGKKKKSKKVLEVHDVVHGTLLVDVVGGAVPGDNR